MTEDAFKKLVAFYSFEGNCRALGGVMAGAVDAEVAEVQPVREISRNFAGKYFAGGKGSLFKKTTEIRDFPVAVGDYGLVIVGTPVWAWNLPPAARAFLAAQDWKGVRTALFVMHRGGRGAALSSMRALVEERGGAVLGTADFVDLRWRDAEKTRERAAVWAREMAALAAGPKA